MANPIWRGHISFGLVNIPIVLYSAERRNDLSFHLVDGRNNARVRYERINEETGEEVPWNEVVKAFEYDDSGYVLLSDEDFKRAAVEATQTIEIEDFVDLTEISLTYFDKPYYLVPGKKGEKGYVLLRETLERTGKAGIARVVIRTKQYLCAVVAAGDGLVLNLLRFPQELRGLDEFDIPTGDAKSYKVTSREIDMAAKLVEAMSGTWKPDKYHDEYRESLMQWIEKKAKSGRKGVTPKLAEEPAEADEEEGEVINIMDLLARSVGQKGKSAGRKKTAKPASKKAARRRKTG